MDVESMIYSRRLKEQEMPAKELSAGRTEDFCELRSFVAFISCIALRVVLLNASIFAKTSFFFLDNPARY
jgi:hypothetical protein